MAACVQKKTIFMCSSGIALCLQAASMHIKTGCRCSRCRHGVPKKVMEVGSHFTPTLYRPGGLRFLFLRRRGMRIRSAALISLLITMAFLEA